MRVLLTAGTKPFGLKHKRKKRKKIRFPREEGEVEKKKRSRSTFKKTRVQKPVAPLYFLTRNRKKAKSQRFP